MEFSNLPEELQKKLYDWKKTCWGTYEMMYGDLDIEDLEPKQLMFLLSLSPGILKKASTFKQGDIICSNNTIEKGKIALHRATVFDVETFSGKNGIYFIFTKEES